MIAIESAYYWFYLAIIYDLKVDGNTKADNAFWEEKCLHVPHNADYVVVKMGDVFDFFRPVEGATYCEMLTSHDKHEWSATAHVKQHTGPPS